MRRLFVFQSRRFFRGKKTFHTSVDLGQICVQTPDLFLLSEQNFVHLLLVMLKMHQGFLHRLELLLQKRQLLCRRIFGDEMLGHTLDSELETG